MLLNSTSGRISWVTFKRLYGYWVYVMYSQVTICKTMDSESRSTSFRMALLDGLHTASIYTKIITHCLLHSYTNSQCWYLNINFSLIETHYLIFHNYFTFISSVHNYATRQKDGLHLFNINTTHGQLSVRHKGCILWNGFPSTLQQNISVSRFKTLLKQHLLVCSRDN